MTKAESQDLENIFKETLNKYIIKRDKKDWDKIYYFVFNACSACCKKLIKGHYISDIQDKIMDATCLSLEAINKAIDSKDKLDKIDNLNISSSMEYWNYFNELIMLERNLNRGLPQKLSNFVYWKCFGTLYDRNTQINEKSISLEYYLEENSSLI